MHKFLLPILVALAFPTAVNSDHFKDLGEFIKGQGELIVTSESTKESVKLARHLKDNGVVKYSAYWCPNSFYQSQLFGKEAYKELKVVECTRDGKNSQTQLCIDKKIEAFPSWEINGKINTGVHTLKELSELTGFKN